MKKLLIAGNCIFFCCAAVLAVLLYKAETRQPVKAVEAVQTVQLASLTPAVTPLQTPPMSTPDPWMLEESYYQPFGELPLPALQQYAGYDAGRAQHSLREENPIDIAFAPYWGQPESTLEENALSAHYQECWEAEVSHALDLLAKQASPAAEYIPEMTQQVRDKLLDFADSSGELYADLFKTDVFLYEGDSPGQTISIGTAYPGTLSIAKAAFFRSYTFYLYDLLAAVDVKPDFVFDAKDVQEEWDYLLQ
jgi:hypothetical protein